VIVLADNDILLKLARCDLFDEFLSVLDVTTAEVRILKTARFSITSNTHRRRVGDASFARLTTFLATISDIDTDPNPADIAALTEQTDKNIDAGEAVLFAVCPLVPDSVIVTGDKKSLAGLAAAGAEEATCAALCRSLAGRVFCFEQVLARVLDRFGFDAVRQKLIDGRECDRGLALWLGSGLDATETAFRDGLTSYLNEARRTSGDLLVH
jgi:hypothetical protein